jgi:hypothetical protein
MPASPPRALNAPTTKKPRSGLSCDELILNTSRGQVGPLLAQPDFQTRGLSGTISFPSPVKEFLVRVVEQGPVRDLPSDEVFLYPNRVFHKEAFEGLEPDDGKASRPILRGPGPAMGSGYWLPSGN